MAKVLLINPPWYALYNVKPETVSLGLTYIAAVLNETGQQCLVYDGDFAVDYEAHPHGYCSMDYETYLRRHNPDDPLWRGIGQMLEDFRPEVVGISVRTAQYRSALNVARMCKDYQASLPVIVGGVHPTIAPEDFLREDVVDIVVRGEGEYTMREVVSCLVEDQPLDRVQGVSYKAGEGAHHNPSRVLISNLDELPFPAKHLVYKVKDLPTEAFGAIITTRGCPFDCIYCASGKLWGKKVRYRTPQNVIAEIKATKDALGTQWFRFNDDTFGLRKDIAMQICDLLIQEHVDIRWMCDTRVDLLSEDLLGRMKEAGCYVVNLGVESGSPEILRFIKKGITKEDIEKGFSMVKEAGIHTRGYFMMGFPGETRDQVIETINFMKTLDPTFPAWSIVTPYPGTELFEIAQTQGALPDQLDWATYFHQSPQVKLTGKISGEEWRKLQHLVEQEIETMHSRRANERKARRRASMTYELRHPFSLIRRRVPEYVRFPPLILKDIASFFKTFLVRV